MNLNDMLSKAADGILAKLKLSDEPDAKQKFEATATIEDGTTIFTTDAEWQEGSPVFTNNADGEPVPVADGEYPLNDGQVLVVVEGLLSELRAAAGDNDEELSEAFSQALQKIADAFNEKLSAMETKFNEQFEALSADNKKVAQKLSTTPASKSAKTRTATTTESVNVNMGQHARVLKTIQLLNK
jgi:hypothetical protein